MVKELVLDVVAKKSSKDLLLLAQEFEALSKKVDDSGKSMQKHATFSALLNDQIAKTKVQVRDLGVEFAKTGNTDIFGQLKGAERNLKVLEKLSKDLVKATATGLEDGAKEGGKSLLQVFQDLPQQIKEVAIPAGIAAGIVASPAIGAAINGALLAGVGLGGLAVGIVGQINDPKVSAAFDELGLSAKDVLTASTTAFAPVLTDAAHNFEQDILRAEPKLQAAFDRLAPHAANVFKGLEGLGAKAAPGFFEALDAAGPILDELGRDLPGLGQAFGTFLHAIADGAPGARDGLHALFVTVDALVEATGYAIEGLSKLYTIEEGVGELLKGDVAGAGQYFADLTTNSHTAADAMQHITEKFSDGALAASQAAGALQKLNGELTTLIGNQLSVAGANDAFQHGLNDLAQALDQNNRSLEGNSDAAIQNREAIRALIEQAERAREAQIQMAGGANASKAAVDQANATYETAIGKIEAVGAKAGLSKSQLDALAGEYDINVVLAVQQVNASALNQLVAPHDTGRYGSAGPPKRAGGGPVTAGMPYIVGDGGVPELFVPSVSGRILPRVPQSSGGGGSTTLTVQGGGGDLSAAIATLMAHVIRTQAVSLTTPAGPVSVGGF